MSAKTTLRKRIKDLETENSALALRLSECETKNASLSLLATRFAMDLFVLKKLRPGQALIVWPSGMSEIVQKGLSLGIAKGSEALSPEDRLAFISRPVAEVDNALVVQVIQRVAKPAEPTPGKLLHLNGSAEREGGLGGMREGR